MDPNPGTTTTTQQGKRGARHDTEEGGKNNEEKDTWKKEDQSDWKDGDYDYTWGKDRDECAWKKDSGGGKWKKSGHDIKCRRFSEEYKWKKERYDDDKWKRDEYKWKKERDEYKWQKNKDNKWRDKKEFHWKNDSDGLKCGKEEEDHKWKKDKDDYRWKKDKRTPPPCLSHLAKAEEPSSSRMALVFPFSDEEDDEDYGDECRATGEDKHETWPISDIVETEDEDGEVQPEGTPRDPPARKGQEDDVLGTAEAAGVKEHASDDGSTLGGPPTDQEPPLAGASEAGPEDQVATDASTPDPLPHTEDTSQSDGPPPAEEDEEEEPIREENTEEDGGKQEEKEPEDERKREEVDSPRDGIRATQRLRPRSYR